MNVFYFSSDLFVSVAAVSIVSLLENNKSFENIHIYMIDDGITEDKREKLTSMIKSYGRSITYIDAPEPSQMFDFPFKSRYQMGHSYTRMLIGTLLPENIDKVLCLDSDTLVLGDLSQLWNIDMENNILAGVADCMNLKAYKNKFHLEGEEFYCNAGVFLVNLKEWREKKVEDEIKRVIHKNNGNVFFFEQTLMNFSCRGKIMKLHPKYNTYTLFYAFEYENLLRWRKPTIFYTKSEIEEAKNNPAIIHFTRNFYMLSRPWVKGCDHPLSDKYIEYKQLTPWKDLEEDNRNSRQKKKYAFWHYLPQHFLCFCASVIYNDIRPKMWWRNE